MYFFQEEFHLDVALKLFMCKCSTSCSLSTFRRLHWRLVTALAGVEDALIFIQDELHYLVLEDHVHGDVC